MPGAFRKRWCSWEERFLDLVEPDDDLNEIVLACLYAGLDLLGFEFFLDWTALDIFSARSATKLSSDALLSPKRYVCMGSDCFAN